MLKKAINWKIHRLKEVSSTNKLAKEAVKYSPIEGQVFVADRQTQGKGRLNRKWYSPTGGLWVSLILKPTIQPIYYATLNIITGIAIAKALRQYNFNAKVKWPNDVVIQGKKVAGILSELVHSDNGIPYLIIGLGLNANFSLDKLPPTLQDKATTILDEITTTVSLHQLLMNILREFSLLYYNLIDTKFSSIIDLWRAHSHTFQKQVTIKIGNEKVSGIVENITKRGEILIQTESELHCFAIGDLSLRDVR